MTAPSTEPALDVHNAILAIPNPYPRTDPLGDAWAGGVVAAANVARHLAEQSTEPALDVERLAEAYHHVALTINANDPIDIPMEKCRNIARAIFARLAESQP